MENIETIENLLLYEGLEHIKNKYVLVKKTEYVPKKQLTLPKGLITIMLFLIIFLFNPYAVGTATKNYGKESIVQYQKELTEQKQRHTENTNIFLLKNTTFSQENIEILNDLLDPIIRPIVYEYKTSFANPDTVINVIKTLATSEGSSSSGNPFAASIWKKDNNPFGIKGKGNIYNTTEEFDGVVYDMKLSFAKFDSFQQAIRYITKTMFVDMPCYKGVRNGKTGEEIFLSLEKVNYFTSSVWREAYLIPTYLKYCNLPRP